MGFKTNPHNRCVANKTINVKQFTIVWYIKDKTISHMDENIVTRVFSELKEHYGDLSISRGKKHNSWE